MNAAKIFVNLPVADVARSTSFFTALGFAPRPEYSNDEVAGIAICDGINALLVQWELFGTFTNRAVADAAQVTEVGLALEVESRERVDEIADAAIAAGAEKYEEVDDEVMYSRGFYDLDGHLWHALVMKAPA
ncbi:glyoxalase [Actinoplanes sp. NBC_00393]|uniref:VOC family protein n=1 Tax=Actinoplanes sp. NBC_00393 TaxID=2975953 RepID=UPI002E22E4C4